MKRVSVIIPAYNAEKTLKSCVLSVLQQDYPIYEIVIVNDGSTDCTQEVCDRLSINEKLIIVHQNNAGVSAARNTGLNLASGDYVVFIDSDDVIDNNYIKILMSSCEFDFVTAGFYMQDRESVWHIYEFIDEGIEIEEIKKYPSKYIGKYYFGGPVGKLFKRDIIEKNNLRFNTEVHSGEDTLFIFNYLKCARNVRILPLSGYKYFYYKTSLSHRFHEDYWKWKLLVEKEIQDFFSPKDEKEQKYLYSRKFDILRYLLRDYSGRVSNEELFKIYKHPFFFTAIKYKMKEGKFMERMLIFSMEKSDYQLYVKVNKVYAMICRIKNKIKRTLKKQ